MNFAKKGKIVHKEDCPCNKCMREWLDGFE